MNDNDYKKGAKAHKEGNSKEAFKWFYISAENNNSQAQCVLSFMYSDGIGVQQDTEKALNLLEKSAKQDFPIAQCELGYMFLKGEVVKQDDNEAFNWFLKSANQDNKQAQYLLGLMYLNGKGVQQDDEKAFLWLNESSEQGNLEARDALNYIMAKIRVNETNPDIISAASETPTHPLNYSSSPRNVFLAHHKVLYPELPIKGGWGYEMEDAVIIDKNDFIVDPSEPFDGIGIEYQFIRLRVYEEFIVTRYKSDELYAGLDWELIVQHLIEKNNRYYDKLHMKITGLIKNDWYRLKEQWESNIDNPDFDKVAHQYEHSKCVKQFEQDFWFDITSFYGSRSLPRFTHKYN